MGSSAVPGEANSENQMNLSQSCFEHPTTYSLFVAIPMGFLGVACMSLAQMGGQVEATFVYRRGHTCVQVLLSTAPDPTGATHWGQQTFSLHPAIDCAPGDAIEGTITVVRKKENHRLMEVRFGGHPVSASMPCVPIMRAFPRNISNWGPFRALQRPPCLSKHARRPYSEGVHGECFKLGTLSSSTRALCG